MSEINLPEGWAISTVGDYLHLKNGFAFKSNNYVPANDNTYPVIRISDLDGQVATDLNAIHVENGAEGFEVKKGDLLIAMSGATTGKVGVYQGSKTAYQNQRVGNLKLHSEIYGNNRYKNHLISALSEQILKIAYGGAQPNISGKAIEGIDIILPPLAEQKVIADKLDTLLAQVEATKARLDRIPQILKTFRQSVLAAAMSGKLTEEWREENQLLEPISLDEIDSYWEVKYLESGKKRPNLKLIDSVSSTEVPTSWINTNIGYVFDVYVGATPSRKNEDYWNGDVPWVSSSEVAFCRINSTKETVTKLGLAKTSTNIHPLGTVMLAMIGQGKTRGQVAILDIEACHNQNTAALRVPTNFVVSEYLYFYLTKQYEETRRVGGGNNQKALNKSFVQALEFPLPPFKEQIQIVRCVEELLAFADRIEQKANAALERVNNLTQSILAKAFRGELTADWRAQNPDLISGDNSAEALLTKIKAEREANISANKEKKKLTRKTKPKKEIQPKILLENPVVGVLNKKGIAKPQAIFDELKELMDLREVLKEISQLLEQQVIKEIDKDGQQYLEINR